SSALTTSTTFNSVTSDAGPTTSFTTSTAFTPYSVPSSVASAIASSLDESTKETWCSNQKGDCTNSCLNSGKNVTVNTCDPTSLQYSCLCSDGKPPSNTRTLASITATSASSGASSSPSVFNPYAKASSISAPIMNVCFVASLTALFVFFARF
ncbi:5708_t:CDS:2, partial [Acaulospora colombiana]